jgi:hypothetical protein
MNKAKKEKLIFGVSFGGSLVAGLIVITLGYYWLGLAIAFVGCFSAVLYSRKIAAKYKMGDERAEFIEGKTYSLTFRVIFITMGILLVILGGLFIRSIEISAWYVIGLLFALTSAVSVASRHYYTKKYS